MIVCQANTVTTVGKGFTKTAIGCLYEATLICPTCRHEVCCSHWDSVAGVCSDCLKLQIPEGQRVF